MTAWIRHHLDVDAPAEDVWDLLIDLDAWPRWGPTVRAAALDDGRRHLSAGATGRVRPIAGPGLPFRVTDWEEGPDERRWSWSVAGVPATTHAVRRLGPDACRVEMGVPWWAPGYVAVTGLALLRLRRLASGA